MNTNERLSAFADSIFSIKDQVDCLSNYTILNDWPDTRKKLLEIVNDLDDIEKAIDYVVGQ